MFSAANLNTASRLVISKLSRNSTPISAAGSQHIFTKHLSVSAVMSSSKFRLADKYHGLEKNVWYIIYLFFVLQLWIRTLRNRQHFQG